MRKTKVVIDDAITDFEPKIRFAIEGLMCRDEYLSREAAHGAGVMLHEAWKALRDVLEASDPAGSTVDPPPTAPAATARRPFSVVEAAGETEARLQVSGAQLAAMRLVTEVHGSIEAFLVAAIVKEADRITGVTRNGSAA